MSKLHMIYIMIVRWSERTLAGLVFLGCILYGFQSVITLSTMDWGETTTFYEIIYRVLLLTIGLELVKMLISHSIEAVIELLIFVIARKTLKPDLNSVDIIINTIAFSILITVRYYILIRNANKDEKKNTLNPLNSVLGN